MKNRYWKYLSKKLRKIFLFERYIIYKRKVDKNTSSRVPEKFLFREAKIEDIFEVTRTFQPHYTDKDHAALMERMKLGEYLILGYFRGTPDRLCMFSWMSEIDPFFLEEKKINHAAAAICNCRVFVLDAYRNMGLSRYSLIFLEHWAIEKHYTEIAAYIRSKNVPQLKAVAHANWRKSGRLYRIVLLGHTMFRVRLCE
jgi:GNAT superfamily N-acetyltransferase